MRSSECNSEEFHFQKTPSVLTVVTIPFSITRRDMKDKFK
jgi:hypothetical protein